MNANCRFWCVYQLTDPRSGAVRYIGITSCSLETRLAYHLSDRAHRQKWQWIRALAAQGLTPGIQEIASLTGTRREAETLERQHLYRALAEGATLLNRQYILGDPDSFREFLQGEMRELARPPSSARSDRHEHQKTQPLQ